MSYSATGWRESGACATVDPDLFYPIAPEGGLGPAPRAAAAREAERALRVCAACPVRRQCLEFALETREAHGIWGGTTPEERARARRKEGDARRYAARTARRAASEAAA